MSTNPYGSYGSNDQPNQNSNTPEQPNNPYAQDPSDYQAQQSQQSDTSATSWPEQNSSNSGHGQQASSASSQNPYGTQGSYSASQNPYGSQSNGEQSQGSYSSSSQNPYSSQVQGEQQSSQGSYGVASQNSYGKQAAGSQQNAYGNAYSNSYSGYQQGNLYGGNAVSAESQPRPHVGLGGALSRWGKNLFHFSGRASRSEFWWVYGVYLLVMTLMSVIFSIWFTSLSLDAAKVQEAYEAAPYSEANHQMYQDYTTDLGMKFIVAILVIGIISFVISILLLSVTWRRMQDAGYHGALSLLLFIVPIVPFVLAFFPSSPNGYKYDKQVDYNRP